ncbi:MAG: ribosomal protein S18-alanine N-acetyltransferase [Acidimicrobiales bacterium]|nr:ribosomal protein S18-alanine N-acetyltransferase [Acidimicrobiales bacterium]
MSASSRPVAAEVVLRPMLEADAGAVLDIDRQVHPDPWSPAFLVGQLAAVDRWHHVVADRNGDIVGHAALTVVADEGHVATVSVRPDEQGAGTGGRLLGDLCRFAVERGLAALTLEVRSSNRRAIELYRRFGFAPAGVRPAYFAGVQDETPEDALVMWVHDIAEPAFLGRVEAAEQAGAMA